MTCIIVIFRENKLAIDSQIHLQILHFDPRFHDFKRINNVMCTRISSENCIRYVWLTYTLHIQIIIIVIRIYCLKKRINFVFYDFYE